MHKSMKKEFNQYKKAPRKKSSKISKEVIKNNEEIESNLEEPQVFEKIKNINFKPLKMPNFMKDEKKKK